MTDFTQVWQQTKIKLEQKDIFARTGNFNGVEILL